MVDVVDQAQTLEETTRAAALAAARASNSTAPGHKYCARCGDEIPAARREALPSATRCVDCQTKRERGF